MAGLDCSDIDLRAMLDALGYPAQPPTVPFHRNMLKHLNQFPS